MKGIIAVDDKLVNVRQTLEAQGYQVSGLDQGMTSASVVVVSWMNDNVTGDQSIMTKAKVIEANGLSAEEVVSEVERAMRINH